MSSALSDQACLAHDPDTGRAALDRAITLNANSAQILGGSGWVRLFLGDFDVARDQFTRAMRLSPLDPELYVFQTGLAEALVLGEPAEPERGLDLVQQALVSRPNWYTALQARVYCLVTLGRLDEAKETARQMLAIRREPSLAVCTFGVTEFPASSEVWSVVITQGSLDERLRLQIASRAECVRAWHTRNVCLHEKKSLAIGVGPA